MKYTPLHSPKSLLDHELHPGVSIPLLTIAIALPHFAQLLNEDFYISLASRILIFALAASSLNLILGFCGLISLGHAAYVGLGAYTVGILMKTGIASLWIAWPSAFLLGGIFAFIVGLISLRTKGVFFIMITLAFAQMLFYLMVSLKTFGGDDGMSLPARSTIGACMDLGNDTTFYYVVLFTFVVVFLVLQRILNSRFGHAIQAIRENESRMAAIGFPVMRYKLAAFTLAGAIGGLSGALLANQSGFVSPALLQWSQSGMLMVMVILGGIGHLFGGLLGATVFLLLEEFLSSYTIHWQLGLGFVLLAVVLAAPTGLLHLIQRPRR